MKRGGPDGGRDELNDDRDEPKRRRRDRSRNRGEADEPAEPLDPEMLDRMVSFLDSRGGSFDYGRFAAEFSRIRKRQLEPHFEFVAIDGKASGRWLIQLPGAAPPDVERDLPPPRPAQGNGARKRRTVGDIIFWDKGKGYGFIKCPEETSQDIFFPKGALPSGMQEMKTDEMRGIEVTFEFFMNPDGKPRADNISRTGGAPRAAQLPPPPPGLHEVAGIERGTGLIVRYDEAKGFGFITSDDGEELFFLRSMMPPEMAGMRKEEVIDTRVAFEIITMPDGKLRASNLVRLEPPRRGGSSRDEPRRSSGTSVVKLGRIVRFDRSKGYGFIKAPGEPEDIFFLPSSLPKDLAARNDVEDMEVEVEFMKSEDGKPRASRVSLPPRSASRSSAGGSGRVQDGAVEEGVIISFDVQKGFGFIAADALGEDVFYLRKELPEQLRQSQSRDQVVNQRVRFEVLVMPDGKYRAERMRMMPSGGVGGGGGRIVMGRVRKFDRAKGYGFITVPGEQDDVFFLPSALPKDIPEDKVQGMDVSLEVYMNEEGKPRAQRIWRPSAAPQFVGMPPPMMMGPPPMGMPPPPGMPPMPPPMGMHAPMPLHQALPCIPREPQNHRGKGVPQDTGKVVTGQIVRYDVAKGYGFISADSAEYREDIFFLKAQLPPELANVKMKEDVEKQHVEFKVMAMPDGKLRASSMELLGAGSIRPDGVEEASDELQLIPDVSDFIVSRGGSCEYDDVSGEFPTVPRQVLEQHFDITDSDGILRIRLLEGQDAGAMDEAPDEDRDPAIPLGPGCQPVGVIRTYDPTKGFGFIVCPGLEEDIFFPFKALPENFRGRKPNELPPLKDVHVSMDLVPGDRGPRAENVNLLLKWHAGDKCWLLKRS